MLTHMCLRCLADAASGFDFFAVNPRINWGLENDRYRVISDLLTNNSITLFFIADFMSFDRPRLALSCRVNDVDQWVKRMPRYASSAQLRAARSLLGWTRAELAQKLGVARQTIDKLENQDDARQIAMRQRLQEKFEEYGIAFQDEDTQGGEGVRFREAPVVPVVSKKGSELRRAEDANLKDDGAPN